MYSFRIHLVVLLRSFEVVFVVILDDGFDGFVLNGVGGEYGIGSGATLVTSLYCGGVLGEGQGQMV